MKKCKLNTDELKECSCLVLKDGRLICDIYDEPIKELKKCPFDEKRKAAQQSVR